MDLLADLKTSSRAVGESRDDIETPEQAHIPDGVAESCGWRQLIGLYEHEHAWEP